MPWQRLGTQTVVGSGVVLEDGSILTNAHVVEYAVGIEVKRDGTSKTFPANVAWFSPTCDLALLEVEDAAFTKGAPGVAVGNMPAIGDEVVVHGYPVGGESLSTTAGVVSRIEMTLNSYSIESVLSVQIDAALNPGNSGGPVLSDGKLVGVAAAVQKDSDGIGFMVPSPVIRHFLQDIKDGTLDGLPTLGVLTQSMDSQALCISLGLDAKKGLLIDAVAYGSTAAGVLRPNDVLLEFDDHTIGSDGTVESEYGPRVDFYYLVRQHQMGDKVNVKLWRSGQEISTQLVLQQGGQRAYTSHDESRPSYRIFAGLLFQPLSYDYLIQFGDGDAPSELWYCSMNEGAATKQRRQWLLLNRVLPHEVNRGYQDWGDSIIDTVNGRVPSDLSDLNRILDSADGQYLDILLLDHTRMVLDLAAARAANPEIMENFGMVRDRYPSTDLQ